MRISFDFFLGKEAPSSQFISWAPGAWYKSSGLPVTSGTLPNGNKWIALGWFFTDEGSNGLINRYLSEGPDVFFKVDGEFIILFHRKNDDTVHVFRDIAGILPIVYGKGTKGLAVSLWPKNVSDLAGVELIPSEEMNRQWPVFRGIISPGTAYGIIKELSGTQYLKISCDEVFALEHPFTPEISEKYGSLKHASKSLGDYFSQAVKKRLKGKSQIVAWLSGGNDSSLLVAVSRQHFMGKIKTIFITFEGYTRDYGKEAAFVASKFQTDHTRMEITCKDYISHLADTIDAIQSPINHPGTIGQMLSLESLNDSYEMILSGKAADTVFGGPLWAPMLFLSSCGRILSPTIRDALMNLSKKISRSNFWHKSASKMLSALGSPFQNYIISGHAFGSEEAVDRVFGKGTWKNAIREWARFLDENEPLRDLFNFDIFNWHQVTYDAEKRLCCHFGLAPCYPFLDYDLIANSLKLPMWMRYHYSSKKASLKKYALNYFDRDFIYKSKEGFGVPLAKWFTYPEFKDILMLPLEERSTKRGWWNARELKSVIEDHLNGNGSDETAESVPWNVINIELWMRICVEGDPVSQYKF